MVAPVVADNGVEYWSQQVVLPGYCVKTVYKVLYVLLRCNVVHDGRQRYVCAANGGLMSVMSLQVFSFERDVGCLHKGFSFLPAIRAEYVGEYGRGVYS